MIRRNPRGDTPEIAAGAFIDPTAIICGRVIVEDDVFVGPYAVIRADEVDEAGDLEPIRIGRGSNIQDGVVIHCKSGAAVTIGSHTSIAHRSIVHGPCVVGSRVFVGFNTVLFDCTVGDGVVIRHNSVVEACQLPAGLLVPSTTTVRTDSDVRALGPAGAEESAFSEDVAATNIDLARGYTRLGDAF